MEWKRVVYHVAVVVAALGMFLPLLYGAVPLVRELLGSNPLLKSLAVIALGWLTAYFTFEERGEKVTAS
ncbi:hypothetical protein [Thermococcus nautili]|uniref:Uncharacterized protein n=2 Tax=Thermococcus nautili TaxID=195522 RepID=W8PMM1_9EURY|nr:hypothetical protein [Thermococcus nautili]AHL23284.1 hypothetical protein BD01_1681 [Thermococcus nautili]CAI1493079.1 conserved protein of unknown function [Thermococcus nautili]